eukprot:GFUD01053852.1.p2 GENE.GFUD01053852.1~~GFUD01053852.1.p2  ORF type:complete len:102 (+),score=35.92 GFUD01053852.1:692-997(+)
MQHILKPDIDIGSFQTALQDELDFMNEKLLGIKRSEKVPWEGKKTPKFFREQRKKRNEVRKEELEVKKEKIQLLIKKQEYFQTTIEKIKANFRRGETCSVH